MPSFSLDSCLHRRLDNGDASNVGKPCGASNISKGFDCHIGSKEVTKDLDGIDVKQALSDQVFQKWLDEDSASAEPHAFAPTEDLRLIGRVLKKSGAAAEVYELMSPYNFSNSELKKEGAIAQKAIDAANSFGVTKFADAHDFESIFQKSLTDKNVKTPEIPGAIALKNRLLSYHDPELASDSLFGGETAKDWKLNAKEIRASDGDDDPIAAMYEQMASDTDLKKAFAQVSKFDADTYFGDGDFSSIDEAKSYLRSVEIASHPTLRAFGKGLTGDREGEDERAIAWLEKNIEDSTRTDSIHSFSLDCLIPFRCRKQSEPLTRRFIHGV